MRRFRSTSKTASVLDWDALEAAIARRENWSCSASPTTRPAWPSTAGKFLAVASRRPGTTFVVDEAFADFLDGYVSLAGDAPENVIVVRSFTKFYAFPGLRLGFAVACESLSARIRGQLTPWSVGALAQAAGVAVLADDAYARRTVAEVGRLRRQLIERLRQFPGLHVYPGEANFLLARLDRSDLTAAALADRLLSEGIAIRTFGPGQALDDRFFRVAVRTEAENERLCDALSRLLSHWEKFGLDVSGPLSLRGGVGLNVPGPLSLRERVRVRGGAETAGFKVSASPLGFDRPEHSPAAASTSEVAESLPASPHPNPLPKGEGTASMPAAIIRAIRKGRRP